MLLFDERVVIMVVFFVGVRWKGVVLLLPFKRVGGFVALDFLYYLGESSGVEFVVEMLTVNLRELGYHLEIDWCIHVAKMRHDFFVL